MWDRAQQLARAPGATSGSDRTQNHAPPGLGVAAAVAPESAICSGPGGRKAQVALWAILRFLAQRGKGEGTPALLEEGGPPLRAAPPSSTSLLGRGSSVALGTWVGQPRQGVTQATCPLPARPGELTRDSLERFLAHLRSDPGTGETRNRTIIVDLKVFLDDVRMLGWEPDLPISAVYHRAELSRQAKALPRFIDEFVMAQIESEEALSKLPDQTTRALVVLLMETGLRSVDAMRLLFDPITRDQAGAPYLVFWNHKLSREAIIPISERLLGELRRQQAQLRERFPDAPPPVLFPRPWANSGGHHPLPLSTLNRRLRNWLSDCDVRDPQGEPVKITSHQFRHTLGTRLVNNEVPLDTIRRLLDHASPTMTAVYAHVKDQTLRREWERYQQRLNIRGETIPLDADGPLSDAAWAKENLSRAKQTLPNGYCGLPLQQRCPHPNACLTCDSFLTTEEFLPQHREQLDRTRELIASARASGNDRLVDMNEPIELNLVRIIQGLNTLQEASSDAA